MTYTGKFSIAAVVLLAAARSAAAAGETPPAQEPDVGRIMRSSGIRGGLVVHVGCGDGSVICLGNPDRE